MKKILRDEPFAHIYKHCNAGNSKHKLANLPDFPRLIDVEMTNTCNFRCLMCPTGTFSQKRAKGFMSREVFYRLLDQVGDRKTPLRFIRWGEPMMHPDIIEFITAAHARGCLVHMNSNGSYFTKEKILELLHIPLDSLKFSFQGIDKKSYGEMRNTDFFEELIDTIRLFKELRGDRAKPFLQVSTSITYESLEQVDNFRALMQSLVDKVSVGRTMLAHLDINSVRLRAKEREALIKLKEEETIVREHPECPEVFDKLSINWDGSISACCADSDNLMLIGDINQESLSDIWTASSMMHYREMLADMRHDELPLCKTCWDEQSLDKPGRQKI